MYPTFHAEITLLPGQHSNPLCQYSGEPHSHYHLTSR
uniref:Uncharacterized protein n=1 Tax=Setaria italica TaxID=4555 RepID=K4A4C9_SETIT